MVSLSFQQPRRQRQGLAGWQPSLTGERQQTTPEEPHLKLTHIHAQEHTHWQTCDFVWGSTLSGNSVAAAITLAWTERTNISTTERSSLTCV